MAKRRYAINKFTILSEEVASFPKMLKVSICIAVVAICLSCASLILQIHSVKLLRRAETKHRTFINRIAGVRSLGNTLGNARKSLDAPDSGGIDESQQTQCRYRQKTEWLYYDSDSAETEGKVTVSFAASEGHIISTASCGSSAGSVKRLKQTGTGANKIYSCACAATPGQTDEDNLGGYEKLTCTANYWECPVQ